MKNIFLIALLGIAGTLVGCAHVHKSGTVVFRDNDKQGHICIDHDGIKEGDIVKVFRSVCKNTTSMVMKSVKYNISKCEKSFLGEGKIVELSDEHFAKIEALGDLNLEQGLIVEKFAK